MTISDFLSALQQRWRIIVATLLIVVATTAVVTMQTPLVYESSTRVYLLASGEGGSGNAYNMPSSEKETLVQVASSPVVLDAVREQLGLPAGTPINVTARTSGDTNLLDVTARSNTPDGAQQIATAVPQELAAVARNFAPSLAMSGQTVDAQVIAPAGTPGAPVEPDIVTNLLLGALAGLLLGIAFAVLRHNIDTRVRSQRDLASLSDRPLLASIPVTDGTEAGHELYVESDPFGAQAEAVRQLRTNMLFVDVTTGGHSFLLTSSLPGEGKTTTTVILGLALADSGLKVLILDADLRHPTVAKTLGLESAVGLTTVLVGAAEPDDVIQQWAGTNLHILAAGEVPPNPSELLGSGAMRTLFHQLTEQFDFILVDTPPVLPVTDALVVSRLTSGSIMVVASGTTRKRHLAEALRVLGTADVELGGFVLTKAPAAPTAYYYYGGGTQTSEYGETRASRSGTDRVNSGGDSGGDRRRRRGRSRSNTATRARRTKRMEKQFPNATRAAEERQMRNETRAAWQPAPVDAVTDAQTDPGTDEQATTASRRSG